MKKIIKISLTALVVLNTIVLVYLFLNNKKIAYIDYNTVYNNCKLKMDLEKDLEKVTNQRKSELDSMQLQLNFMSQSISSGTADAAKIGEFEDLKNMYLTLQEKYQQENMRLKEAYFTQIRQDINDKAALFRQEQGYDYLFAAVGDGALMSGSESEDVTKEFQEFIDKK